MELRPLCDDDTDAFFIGVDEEDDDDIEPPADPLPDLRRRHEQEDADRMDRGKVRFTAR